MKKMVFLAIIFMSQFAYSENISLICSMVKSGETDINFSVVTFDTESKNLKRIDGNGPKVFLLGSEIEGRYQWEYSYKYKDKYDVTEYYTLNRTTLFMSYAQDFGGAFTNEQGQCYRQDPQI
jgi:hypothetical protein